MALEFHHVKLLKYSHTPVLLDAGLRFRIEKRLSIIGRLADINNTSGVNSLNTKEQQVLTAATDYDDIVLNGVSFGVGRIDNIQFDGGVMVRDENYTYDITCYEEGDLFNATNGVYQGLSWTNAKNIETLSESLSYQEDKDGTQNYSHSVEIKFTNYSSATAGINSAKTLASIFFNAKSGLGAFLGDFTGISSAKKLHSESYNLIDCSCSFTETCSIPKERYGNYSKSFNYSVSKETNGFVTVTEQCSIKGLTTPPYAGAQEGLNSLLPGAFARCSDIYDVYDFSDAPLFESPVSRAISINKFTGEISIESVYSNDPKYHLLATWEYTLECSRDEQNYYTITESGRVNGHGRPLVEKMGNAVSFFNATVAPDILARVTDLYSAASGRSLSLFLTSQSDSRDEYGGSINYSRSYTDSNLYSSGDIRKTEVSIVHSKPTHLVQNYNIFNHKEIVQSQKQSTMGEIQYDIKLRGKRGTSITTYLSAAQSIVNGALPAYDDRYVESVQYNLSPRENAFDFSLTLRYAGVHKSRNDIILD